MELIKSYEAAEYHVGQIAARRYRGTDADEIPP
jgi:hypothetical protein